MSRSLSLSRPLLAQMQTHVVECLPEEACGILGGSGNRASRVIPLTNELHSPTCFRTEALELLDALQSLEGAGLDLVAIFHSHPTGPSHPSITDVREFAYPGAVSLIWSPGDAGWQVRGYWIEAGGFEDVSLTIT